MKNRLEPGEFVQAIEVPLPRARASVARLQDLEALRLRHLGRLRRRSRSSSTATRSSAARLAFGGMAATPKRAAQRRGRARRRSAGTKPPSRAAMAALGEDFAPLTDMRASAAYRLQVAQNLLRASGSRRAPTTPLAADESSVWSDAARRLDARYDGAHAMNRAARSAAGCARRRRGGDADERRARRRRAAARIGAPARRRRRALRRRHARARRHAARRARPVAGRARPHRRRSISTRMRAMPGVVAVLTAADIPGANDCGPVIHDDPILADGVVQLPRPAGVRGDRRDARRGAPRRGAGQGALTIEPLPPILTPQRGARRASSYVLPPMHLARGDAARRDRAPRRTGSPARSTSAARSSSISKARSRTRCRSEDDGMLVHCSTQHPSEMQHLVAHCARPARRTTCRSNAGAWAAASAARNRSRRCSPASPRSRRSKLRPAGQAAPRPRRRLPDHRQAPLLPLRVRSRLRRRRPRSSAPSSTMVSRAGFSADLSGPVMTRAVCHFDNAYWLPDVAIHGYSRQDQHAEQHRVSRLRRAAGRDRDREHPRHDRARSSARIRSTCAAPTSTASRDGRQATQRHAVRPGRRGQHHPRAGRRARGDERLPRAARGDRRVQRDERGAEARHRADAGQVRHLVQPRPPQPGRRAGPRLRRRLGAGQPRRHRDGPGPQHQGRAGRRARARRRLRRACASPRPTRSKVANTSATAASTGSDLNGKAAQDAARQIRERLAAFAARALRRRAPATCASPTATSRSAATTTMPFRELVAEAYLARVQLWSDGFYATPGPVAGTSDDDAGPAVLLLRLRRGGERGRGRHADRRVEAAARRRAARRRQVAQPGDRHRPGRGRASSRAWAG